MRSYTGGATALFSNHLSNEFRANYTSNETAAQQTVDAFAGNTPVNLGELVGLGAGSDVGVGLFYGSYGFGYSRNFRSPPLRDNGTWSTRQPFLLEDTN